MYSFCWCCAFAYTGVDSSCRGREPSIRPQFLSTRPAKEATLDSISDIFQMMRVTAFGQHRLEATAPWGLIREKEDDEKLKQAGKQELPTDLAHFAMLSRGNCWLRVEDIRNPIPLRRNGR